MNTVSTLLFPVLCPGCGSASSAPCVDCAQRCERAEPLVAPVGVDAALAALRYDGVAREVILALKYRSGRTAAVWLSDCLAAKITEQWGEQRFDVVSWIPAAPRQRRQRGFDQGRLLAVGVSSQLGVPIASLLIRRGQRQTGLQRSDRLAGPALSCHRDLVGRRILLVDDVITTGASITAAGRALRSAGAAAVSAAAAASTPPG